ncbi:MAG TPA: hypothetical protein VID27_02830 [Blastocatellia bacterium]|jgi:hypothetical protein
MDKEEKRALKIFAQYGLLIALLAGFNFYNYYRGMGMFALIAALVCVMALVGWTIFYIVRFRRKG